MEQRFVAHGLIEDAERVLLLRRRHGRYLGGWWDIPGGSVEAGETPEEACAREFLEEAGIEVLPVRELSRQVNLDTEGRPIEFVTVTYLVLPVGAALEVTLAPDEHDAFAWMLPEDVLEREDVVWHVPPAVEVWAWDAPTRQVSP